MYNFTENCEPVCIVREKNYNSISKGLIKLFNDMGLTGENPLSKIIKPGDTVLIKPNLVRDYTSGDFEALVTNGKLIIAIVKFVKMALGGTGRIVLGDSPVQDSDFEKTLKKLGIDSLEAIDFRREIVKKDKIGIFQKKKLVRKEDDYVAVDLKEKSELMKIIKHSRKFRITQYDDRAMKIHHNNNNNEYLIPKCVLDADVVINIPKLKTHRKAGITCALKNLVGLNGDKSWLPHHRAG